MTCVTNYEMCGFLKWNFKILNKNFYYCDFIYKESNCMKNDEMCGFLKFNFKM